MSDAPLYGGNFAGTSLAGFDTAGKSLQRANFSSTTGLAGADFAQVKFLAGANLSKLDLTGFSGLGKRLAMVNFSVSSGLTPQALALASNLQGADLSNTSIQPGSLRQAMLEANWQAGASIKF